MGRCYTTQRALPDSLWESGGVGWGGEWEGGSRGRGHMYAYAWFTLLYGRNQHNIIQHYPPIKNKVKKKKKNLGLLKDKKRIADHRSA